MESLTGRPGDPEDIPVMDGVVVTVNDVTKYTILEAKVSQVLQLSHKTIF